MQGAIACRDDGEEAKTSCRFSKLMMKGRVRMALWYLSKMELIELLSLDQVMTEEGRSDPELSNIFNLVSSSVCVDL